MRILYKLALSVIIALPMQSIAALHDVVDKAFADRLSTSTPASQRKADENQRGFLYGGSYKLRLPAADNTPILSVKAPKFKAGCNGIDANFGALSYMDGEDIKELLRKSVAAGSSYAFSLAMNAICGSCLSSMENLAKKVNALTAGLSDSCENGKALARLAGSGMDKLTDQSSAIQQAKAGLGESVFGGEKSMFSEGIAGLASYAEGWPELSPDMIDKDVFKNQRDKTAEELMEMVRAKPDLAKKITNNLVHTMVVKQKMSHWFTSDTTPTPEDLNEDAGLLMALIGSRAVYPVLHATDKTQDRLGRRPLAGGQWKEFFGGHPVYIYDCATVDLTHPHAKTINDSVIRDILADGCPFPTRKKLEDTPIKTNIKSYQEYVDRVVAGLTQSGAASPTTVDLNYMQHDPMQSIALLKMSGPAIYNTGEALKGELAELIVKGSYVDWAEKVVNAIASNTSAMPDDASATELDNFVIEARQSIAEQAAIYNQERLVMLGKIQKIDQILDRVSQQMAESRVREASVKLAP